MRTLEEILDEYAKKQAKARAKAEQEERAFFEDNAEVLSKKNEMRHAALAYMKDCLTEGVQPDRERAESVVDSIKKGVPVFSPKYECSACGDTGFIKTDRGAVFCDCLLERMYCEIYGGQNVEELAGEVSKFDRGIFKDRKQLEDAEYVRDLLLEYIEEFPNNATRTVLFMGEAGLGKTFLMSAVAKELYKKTRRVLFIDSFSLFSAFHKNRLGTLNALDPIFDADVLMIDDLGTEPFTQNVTREYFFRLIEYRTLHRMHTFATTNLGYAALKERYTEKSVSRMLSTDRAAVLDFHGRDLRLDKKG